MASSLHDSSLPLCVDLDGTLIRTDSMIESAVLLLAARPGTAFLLSLHLFSPRARLKEFLTRHLLPDPATLPYRQDVLAFLNDERKSGRRLVLVTGAHQRMADAVASHLGLFSEVHATHDSLNLVGSNKARFLTQRFGPHGFDYIGDSSKDLPVWESARQPLLVHTGQPPSWSRHLTFARTFSEPSHQLHALLQGLRPHHWLKNLLVFLPLIAAHRWLEFHLLISLVIVFFALNFLASGTYLINDLLDVESDRRHHRKKNRPLASGLLPHGHSLAFAILLVGASLLLSLLLAPAAVPGLCLYLALTMAYSFAGKTWLLADLLILTCLFLLRIALGGATTNIPISPWFLSFAAALFLSLAALKRWIECREIPSLPHPAPPMRRSYRQQHAPFVLALGLTSALASVSILAAYIYSPTAQSLYAQPQILFGLPLILALWLARAWTLAARGSIHDDPLVHAVKDPWSYYLFLPALILFWAARPAVLPP